jgi:hypothetical protein
VLPRWIGHDDLQRTYTAHVDIRGGIADVRIDTTYRLADAYQLNNSLRLPFEAVFDNHVWNPPDRRVYQGFVRPDLWWNGFDGLKGGVHFHSSWMNYKHKLTPSRSTCATRTAPRNCCAVRGWKWRPACWTGWNATPVR